MIRLALLFLAGASLRAEQLPHVTAETLAGNKLELPVAISGQITVLCLGFSHASQTQVRPWTATLRARFSQQPSLAVYPIAVLEDAPRLVRGMIVHAMKGDVPQADWKKFFVLYNGEKELKRTVAFQSADDAYLLILDPTGTILYKLHGQPSAASVNDLSSHITAVLGESKTSK